ncbi:GDSL-type esterase/lipase family protein [Actinoplanes sp. N902-109]|uniref:GDSL-type esterase/lipase family protein n=1 Tax=Actinoplanes sp. (strain N902-109) TaxID=649831 RepID=UPI00032940E5|nr:GDSL-type esterase/lipase family protein [Actinoplanes sp. N902-109]AGL16219.1 hypothetical protein L083_2709 [Actinoplanes sp. N902-109]
MRNKGYGLLATAVAVACATTMPGAVPSAAAATESLPTALVTMGDSFISGEAGRWQGNSYNYIQSNGTDRGAAVYGGTYGRCDRSDSAEAPSSGILTTQINIACSGATTENIFRASQGGKPFKGERPQADQLAELARAYDVRVIALSIGGNDLGFSSIIERCITDWTARIGACKTAQQQAVDSRMRQTRPDVVKAVREIQATMLAAGKQRGDYRIILQSAPSPIPRARENRYPQSGFKRLNEGGCPFYDADLDWARDSLTDQIADMQQAIAEETGADFLDLRDALQDREVCSVHAVQATKTVGPSPSTSEWARYVVSGFVLGLRQESFHPNYYAQLALGRCLALLAGNTDLGRTSCHNVPGQGPEAMYLVSPSLSYIETAGNTANGKVQVYLASRDSGYQRLYLQSSTAFGSEADGTWQLMPNEDLAYIKTRNTASGHVEVHIASRASGYTDIALSSTSAFRNENDGVWQLMPNEDLVYIKTRNTGSGRTEVHIASRASGYQSFVLQTATAFRSETDGSWQLLPNGDLAYIKTRNTGTGRVEVHIVSRASAYQDFIQQTGTVFLPEDNGSWQLLPNEDLAYIKTRDTGSGRTEVHIASRASGYQAFSLQTPTVFAAEDNGRWALLAP